MDSNGPGIIPCNGYEENVNGGRKRHSQALSRTFVAQEMRKVIAFILHLSSPLTQTLVYPTF
jgi:hypothetical protein